MSGRFNFFTSKKHQRYYTDLLPEEVDYTSPDVPDTKNTRQLIISNNTSARHHHLPKTKPTIFHRTLKIIAGLIGLGAGALYFGPAETCAKLPHCGGWLVDLIHQLGADEEVAEKVVISTLAAGGVDFAGGAGLMGL